MFPNYERIQVKVTYFSFFKLRIKQLSPHDLLILRFQKTFIPFYPFRNFIAQNLGVNVFLELNNLLLHFEKMIIIVFKQLAMFIFHGFVNFNKRLSQ